MGGGEAPELYVHTFYEHSQRFSLRFYIYNDIKNRQKHSGNVFNNFLRFLKS